MKLNDISKKIRKATKSFGKAVDKHSPEILIGCGLAGFLTTVILVAKETPEAQEEIKDLHLYLGNYDDGEITKGRVIFEEAKVYLRVYAPAIASGTLSCGCILASYHIANKRTAAIATAYELCQSNLIDYQNKVREKLGEKKEKEIRHEINEEDIKKNPPPEQYRNELAYTDGLTVFKDCFGRYFRSNIDIVRRAEKTITKRLQTEMEVSLNEFYWELDIGPVDVGDDLYFTADNGIDVVTDSIKNTDGNTITKLDFLARPMPRYRY